MGEDKCLVLHELKLSWVDTILFGLCFLVANTNRVMVQGMQQNQIGSFRMPIFYQGAMTASVLQWEQTSFGGNH